ncbi:ABC transporter permease [Mucilaginibacter gotjawali]|uniref:ABC transport system permease protein n=2 Tax=Mucilaginibacter gotjawali TaxID=1550579 RepID=A0A839SJ22_9SPHI|nr:ABC transporter permease [Mucilaginibacter gotjawali]MBB3056507.1 putative ABC transport system permease protein [Mucilaginibacter gotjawali]BAU52791.1 putative ABC transporter permease YknZ [Mucilaginibacter gotjawali]
MIKNYLKTAFRSLQKNKGFTAINVLGLALGLATCLLIVFYVFDELSYDRYNANADRIYRVNEDLKLGNNRVQYAVCMAPLAQTLKTVFPDVENTVRLKNIGGMHVNKGAERFLEYSAVFADPSVFDVFTLPIIYGDKKTALTEPNTVVITEATAKKYFGRTDVVGENLIIDGNLERPIKVTAVIKNIPEQSHFHADFLVSMSSNPESRSTEWLRSDFNTYVLMRKGADYKKTEAQFAKLLRNYSGDQMQAELKMSYDKFEKSGSFFRLNMMPLTDIHLHSSQTGELGINGTSQYVYIFSAIAIFILLIACVNFMNLSTARSSNRAREVGVRKVLGSPRKYLIAQFLSESILITLVAVVIAILLALFLLPGFNQLSGKNIVVNSHTLIWLLPSSLVAVLFIGFLAGLYPAFFLSAFQPIDVLKGKISNGFKGGLMRSFLVVFQFSISIFLIIGTLVIYNQLHYIQNRDLGYSRSQVLVIDNAFELGGHAKAFKQEIKQIAGVENATLTGFLPTAPNRSTAIFYKQAQADPKQAIFPQTWNVDEDYVNTLGMKMAAGRNFSSQMSTDSNSLVINSSAAKFLGFTDPVNKIIYKSSGGTIPTFKPYTIIGVVKDFNFSSLHDNISPVIMQLGDDEGALSVKVQTANLPALLRQAQNAWKGLSPAHFQYSFMDQDFNALYQSEQNIGTVFVTFTILAIVIACLGLFGLAAYAAEQRTKEIGIRKVLGASISSITRMLSKDFIKLVCIAILISSPLAWYAMNKWLQGFAYRADFNWWFFVAAGGIAICIAFITVSFQSIKAALMNPVKSLKSE